VTHVLSSCNWVFSSSLDLLHNWVVFCGGCEYAIERLERFSAGTYDFGSRL
jgi:hypothetical protein